MKQENNKLTGADYLKATLCSAVYDVADVTPLEKMEKISSRIENRSEERRVGKE